MGDSRGSQATEGSSATIPAAEELQGIAGSPGVAIGPAEIVVPERRRYTRRRIAIEQVPSEMLRFDGAVAQATAELRRTTHGADDLLGAAELAILDAYILMLNDVQLRGAVETLMQRRRFGLERAIDETVANMAAQLRQSQDPYLSERSGDFEFAGDLLLRALVPETLESGATGGSTLKPRIIIAHDLSPAETATFTKDDVLGIVTEVGTRSSHTAILARALEIPAVVGCKQALRQATRTAEPVIVDGNRGRLVLAPTPDLIAGAERRARKQQALVQGLLSSKNQPATTACGTEIQLLANIELPHEGAAAIDEGATGIGLYRTEFLFIERGELPTEDEQYEAYRRVISDAGGRPVVLRTFDVGADKSGPGGGAEKEANPALGVRGIRLGLRRADVLVSQFRAIARASSHGPVQVMLPMVSSITEMVAAKQMLAESLREVDQRQQPRAQHVPLGCMVEVPAAALNTSRLAQHAEFFSIGTNDLVQYTLAVDRSNQELAHLASHFDPAVLKLIRLTLDEASDRRRPVSICGAMASDPYAAVLLMGIGLRTFSMEAASIPAIKEILRRLNLAEARECADAALEADSAEAVEHAVRSRFQERLLDLIEFD